MPETSIIIRTFNEQNHLGNLLKAIKEQDYQDYEIIIIDSGSTDRTLEIAKESVNSVLQIESRDFTFGYSLNLGCRQSQGQYLVFISAHVLPTDNQWLSHLLAPLKSEKVAMVYGRQIGSQDSKFSEKRDLARIFKKTPYPNNANSAIKKSFWQTRPFDEYLFGLEDVEWAKYITEKGFSAVYEPKAAIFHIHHEKWAQIFNRYRREAIAGARIGLSHPPQARPGFLWFMTSLLQDILASLPKTSWAKIEEIGRFRYYQWKGTRQGWYHDKDLDLQREKYALYYSAMNQAVVIKNKYQASFQEMLLPELKPGDILIRVAYVGVCRTDLEVYDSSLGYYQKGLAKYPIVPGHEFSGTIVQIGANNKYRERFKVGESVIGECILSRGGNSQRQEVGVINYNGAYSQFIIMPGQYLHKIPEGMDLKIACLSEPLAVVLRALRRVSHRLRPNGQIAVVGAGSIGNLITQVLILRGFSVTVFDRNGARLELLKSKAKAVSNSIKNLNSFDLIIEATGSLDVLKQILAETEVDSTLLLLGFPYGKFDYNFEEIVGKEKVIVGSVGGEEEDFDEALELLPQLDTAPFLQAVLPLEKFHEAWKLHQEAKLLKIILKP